MNNYMVIAGCSHSSGAEIDGTMDSVYNRQHSFGNLFAKKMGYIPINVAVPGATNTLIARTVLSYFDQNKKLVQNKTNNFAVMINWTESLRLEAPVPFPFGGDANESADFALPREEFIRINPWFDGYSPRERPYTESYQPFMIQNEAFCQIYTLNLILQMQYFCQANNFRYFMSSSGYVHTPECNTWTKSLVRQVDDKHYYNFRNIDDTFYMKFKNRGFTNTKAVYGHFGEDAHKAHADDLYTYFKRTGV